MRPVKLLIADVDGTLLTREKVLTTRACDAVDHLRSAGIQFTIASGRPPRGMAMLIAPLKLRGPIAAFNGGMLINPDLSVLDQRVLPLAVARMVVDYLLEMGLDIWIYRGLEWFIRSTDAPHVDFEQRTVQFEPTVIRDLYSVLNGAVKIVGVSDDPSLMARCEIELRRRVGANVSASRSQSYYLDITHPEANKGMVVRMISQFFKIPTEEIAVIGDMPNDVLMFGVAGMSIAMGNANADVQRTSRYVTTSNENEGFANAVDNIVLGMPRTTIAKLGLPSGTQACLFDLDGVLTRTAKLHAVAWKQMFDEFLREWSVNLGTVFVPFDPDRDYKFYVDGKLRVDGERSFLASRNISLSEDAIRELSRRKDAILLRLLEHERVETYGDSVQYVHAARGAGLRTAVVSSSKHCQQVLVSAGIIDLFDARIDGNIAEQEHLAGKPAPDTYLAAAHALDVDPAQAVVFEDALSGVEAGRTGHFGYVVGVDRVGQGAELRCHGADRVVTELSALLEQP